MTTISKLPFSVKESNPLIQLSFDKGTGEYKAEVKSDSLAIKKRFVNKYQNIDRKIAVNAIPPLCGFKGKYKIDQETGGKEFLYWRTDSDSSAIVLAECGDYVETSKEVREIISRLKGQIEKSAKVEIKIPFPENEVGYRPRGYQMAGIKYIHDIWNEAKKYGRDKGVLLADEVGLGKTCQVLGAIIKTPWIKRTLVVCPSSVKTNWELEMKIWFNINSDRFTEQSLWHANGRRIKRNLIHIIQKGSETIPNTPFVIVNYDLLRNKNILSQILRGGFDCIVGDEGHYIKNPRSARTVAFKQLHAPAKILMTATLVNKTKDAYAPLSWLYPKKFGSRYVFNSLYCQDFRGAARLGRDLRATIMLARKKVDVAKDLPPQIRYLNKIKPDRSTQIKLDRMNARLNLDINQVAKMSQSFEDYKKRVENDLRIAKEEGNLPEVQARAKREFNSLCQSLQYFDKLPFREISEIRRQIGVLKIPFAIKRIEEIMEEKESMVVFYHHKEVGDAIEKHFGSRVSRVDGSVSGVNRQRRVDAFMKGDKSIFLGSISACGAGINLQRADFCLFIERDWNATTNEQVEGRIHRIGQKFPCTYEVMVFEGSLDARMAQIHAIKSNVGDMLLAA